MDVVTLYNARQSVIDGAIQIIPIYGAGSFGDSKHWWQRTWFFTIATPITLRLSSGQEVTIPVGFRTDLASVPRLLWSFTSPYGDFLLAAILHDYLYVNAVGTRKEADREMLIWSHILCDNHIDNFLRFLVVRASRKGSEWWANAAARVAKLKSNLVK